MKLAKENYSLKIQRKIVKEPAKAWTDIKNISGLPTNATSSNKPNPFTSDDLNTFFTRYEKPSLAQKPDITNNTSTDPPPEIKKENVLNQLKGFNSRKGPGQDGVIPKVLKIYAYQLALVISELFNLSIQSKSTPTS